MENKEFAVFILTHGRPKNVITYNKLRNNGYTGKIYLILDNEDASISEYISIYGEEQIKIFDKIKYANIADEGNNFDNRKAIIFARNAAFDIAIDLGIKYFVAMEDDYYYFGYRYNTGAKKINNLDKVFEIVLKYYKNTSITSIAFGQGGDHIGGFSGIKLKRKCMNSYFCSVDRRFDFICTMNDDVNTYVNLGNRGYIFFTFTNLQLDQKDTQAQGGGATDWYKKYGTYCKSFTTVMVHPSGVKVSLMNAKNTRLHHIIKWNNTTPMIINEKYKKNV